MHVGMISILSHPCMSIPRRALFALIVSILFMSQSDAFSQTIADYSGEFISGSFAGQTRAGLSNDGWNYLTNSGGAMGTSANYTAMPWNTSLLAFSADGTTAGGYLKNGPSVPGRGTSNGSPVDRFSIAAYTLQAGESGAVYLTN